MRTNNYRKSSHSIFDIKLHITWIVKYRKKVLTGDLAERLRVLVRRIAEEHKTEIISGAISQDHVHILVSINPSTSVSKLMQQLKGRTSHQLQMEYPSLRKQFWGQHFWARGYFCVSVGNITDEMTKQYIEHHFEGEEGKDSFRIEP
jgi:putative transposase